MMPQRFAGCRVKRVDRIFSIVVTEREEPTIAYRNRGKSDPNIGTPQDGWAVCRPMIEPICFSRNAVMTWSTPIRPVVSRCGFPGTKNNEGQEAEAREIRSNMSARK